MGKRKSRKILFEGQKKEIAFTCLKNTELFKRDYHNPN